MLKSQKTTLLQYEQGLDQRDWYVADMTGQVLGRAASRIASVLRGKHKATYTPHIDSGDFVVVINAGQLKLTGNKPVTKLYRYHTEFPGGLRETVAAKMIATDSEEVIRRAVWGMLPKNRLGRKLIKKLKIYSGANHNHSAQQPKPLQLT